MKQRQKGSKTPWRDIAPLQINDPLPDFNLGIIPDDIDDNDDYNYEQEEILRIALEACSAKRSISISDSTNSNRTPRQTKHSKTDAAPETEGESDDDTNLMDVNKPDEQT